MQLLVSVASAADADAACAGGADVIDAKDPAAGALGAVRLDVLREIGAAVAGARAVTAALGDADDESSVEERARTFTAVGAALVKVGLAGVTDAARATSLLAAAVRGAEAGGGAGAGVVAVAYADAGPTDGIAPLALIGAARAASARGVLLDTADKRGPGLLALASPVELAGWVAAAHEAGLFAALAGKLAAADLAVVRAVGADVAGVRGAACVGGRGGRVVAERVRALRASCVEAGATAGAMALAATSARVGVPAPDNAGRLAGERTA